MKLIEVQIDRLVGPTHHFGGLGVGNVASQKHAGETSNPRAAALQGLDKMRLVASFGVPQLILPPQPRPDYQFLRSLGFGGSDAEVLRRARDEAPDLLSAASSCSAMWTANAATVTPGIDSNRQRTNLTIANLDASIHRAIEPGRTRDELLRILADICIVHDPLPGGAAMRDEGAANHMRLSAGTGAGINIFVDGDGDPAPKRRWPRQSRAASESIARLHGLPRENTFFFKQHPDAIDAGAFHNDVVAMSHENLLIHHQFAFTEDASLAKLEQGYRRLTGQDLIRIEVAGSQLSIEDAVKTYLFNSQIVSPAKNDDSRYKTSDKPVIICTSQVRDHAPARVLVDRWVAEGIFAASEYVDLDQSMSGGGGPACLRLRVPMPEQEVGSIAAVSIWSESTDDRLRRAIEQHYTSELTIDELASEEFHVQARRAQNQIVKLLSA